MFKNLKVGLGLVLIFIYSQVFANYKQEALRDVLETKRLAVKLNNYFRSKLANHRSSSLTSRRLEPLSRKFYPFYKLSKQLHRKAIVETSLGFDENGTHDYDLEIKEYRNYLKALDHAFSQMISHKNYKYLKGRSADYTQEIAYRLKSLEEFIQDEEFDFQLSLPISKLASIRASRLEVESEQKNGLEDFYQVLGDHYKTTKNLYFKYRNKSGHRVGRKNERRQTAKQKIYSNLFDQLSEYRWSLRRLKKSIKNSFDIDEEKFEISKLQEKLISNGEMLNQIVESFNLLGESINISIDDKKEISDLIEEFHSLNHVLKNNHKEVRESKIEGDVNLTEVEFEYKRATEVCSMLGGPGNILLRRSHEKDIDLYTDFNPRTSGAIKLIEALKFSDSTLDFRHAEVITEIERDTKISTLGFYPLLFNKGRSEEDKIPNFLEIKKGYRRCDSEGCDTYNDYRTNLAWLRVRAGDLKEEREKRESSLKKIDQKEKYPKIGVCSDFVNWTYGNEITSDWNFIPVVKNLVQFVYIPEGFQTPDDLYDSYMTETVCEIENRQLTYPKKVNARKMIARLLEDKKSSRVEIKTHAEKTLDKLKKKNIIDQNNKVKADIINFKYWLD